MGFQFSILEIQSVIPLDGYIQQVVNSFLTVWDFNRVLSETWSVSLKENVNNLLTVSFSKVCQSLLVSKEKLRHWDEH